MSVPEGEREEKQGPRRYPLLVSITALTTYTLQITKNDKVFLPEYQRALTDQINAEAIHVYIWSLTANEVAVRVGTRYQEEDWQKRRQFQVSATESCNRLLGLISIAYHLFHLSSKRVEYWGEMTKNIRNRIRAWSESDSRRYSTI